ncbi:hypothetical protein F5B22DRAFT_626047 [Xylaria bambusicola]|uniref:uncharacterized protein n=1 Tax=Xylaria bambusicola TaxID=326684 RepID=UPI0020077185|nr:uncharacterized protein F5B22DRAFT_626047 [Xylaria bambusicola]KAI0505943.1 hypothetical protein F5B22DRAFT_626047 [Xylaria bambusicola]
MTSVVLGRYSIHIIMAGKKNSAPTKFSGKRGATSSLRTTRNQKLDPQQNPKQEIEDSESEEELKRQQILLNIFSDTFRDVLEAEDFSAQLQEVKAALFNRDFEGAFAREAALDVYAARWSPTRALCYGQVLRGLDSHLSNLTGVNSHHNAEDNDSHKGGDEFETRGSSTHHGESALDEKTRDAVLDELGGSTAAIQQGDGEREGNDKVLRILAIGGAAAEIVAFADYISSHNASTISTRAEITLLDVGPWASVVQRLQTALTTTPPISRYASAAAREANKPLTSPQHFQSSFAQKDILSLSEGELSELIAGRDNSPVLITLLFTLNELYTTSGIKRTTSFLRLLSSIARSGTLLLVIDSPGSYSEAAVGKEAKRYPMQWLLDHTLLDSSRPRRRTAENDVEQGKAEKSEQRWEKIESNDSVWFRVAEGLRYPISLENMRYQMHLYRACSS